MAELGISRLSDVDLPRLLFRLGPRRLELNAPLVDTFGIADLNFCEASPKLRESRFFGSGCYRAIAWLCTAPDGPLL